MFETVNTNGRRFVHPPAFLLKSMLSLSWALCNNHKGTRMVLAIEEAVVQFTLLGLFGFVYSLLMSFKVMKERKKEKNYFALYLFLSLP